MSTRIWYEPTPGLRFAGVVLGKGTLPNTLRVLLTVNYWAWKGRSAPRNAAQPAISVDRTFPRDTVVHHLDGEGVGP